MIEVTKEEILRLKTKILPVEEALAEFNNERMEAFVREALEKAPDGFWLSPSSSSGKYHPPFDQVIPGGLVNHMLVVLYFVERGIQRYPEFTDKHSRPYPTWLDLARAAAMVHDIAKSGIPWGEHTVSNHGHVAALFLEGLPTFQKLGLSEQDTVSRGVKWHMGRWERGYYDGQTFAIFELLIQEADYYSTQKRVRVAGFNLINYECEA